MKNRKKELKAFTLVELLVVISIIALLMGILVPSLQKAREQAQSISCRSKIDNLNMALMMYLSDNNNKGPLASVEEEEYWLTTLAPYFGEELHGKKVVHDYEGAMDIMDCPSTRPARGTPPDSSWGSAKHNWRFPFKDKENYFAEGSYGLNMWIGGWKLTNWVPPHLAEAYSYRRYVPGGVDVPTFSDSIYPGFLPYDTDQPPVDRVDPINSGEKLDLGFDRICLERHGESVNVAFTDGHVEKVSLNKLWNFKWHKKFKKISKMPMRE